MLSTRMFVKKHEENVSGQILLSWMQIYRDTTRGTKTGQKGGLLSPLEDWAKDVVLGVPGWTPEAKAFLTKKPGAFRAAMHCSPAGKRMLSSVPSME